MPKKFTIRWTPKVIDTLESILISVIETWGYKTAKKVDNDINEFLKLLESNSKLCPPSKIENIRRCVISEQTSLIYRIKGSSIELITFIPNKSNHNY